MPDLHILGDRYPNILDDTKTAGLQSTASIRMFRADRPVAGAVGVGWVERIEFTPIARSLLTTVSEMCAQALDRSQVGDARTQFVRSLQYALLSNTGLREGLDIAAEYIDRAHVLTRAADAALRARAVGQLPEAPRFGDILYRGRAMAEVIERAQKVAPRTVPVLGRQVSRLS